MITNRNFATSIHSFLPFSPASSKVFSVFSVLALAECVVCVSHHEFKLCVTKEDACPLASVLLVG